MHILNDVFEYESVVNEFFLPVLKNKLENPKDELEEEIEKQIASRYSQGLISKETHQVQLQALSDSKNLTEKSQIDISNTFVDE